MPSLGADIPMAEFSKFEVQPISWQRDAKFMVLLIALTMIVPAVALSILVLFVLVLSGGVSGVLGLLNPDNDSHFPARLIIFGASVFGAPAAAIAGVVAIVARRQYRPLPNGGYYLIGAGYIVCIVIAPLSMGTGDFDAIVVASAVATVIVFLAALVIAIVRNILERLGFGDYIS